MSAESLASFNQIFEFKRDVNQSSDQRIGSARNNASSATINGLSGGTNSASASQLLTTLIPVTIYLIVCLIFFITLRTRCPRAFAPRSILTSLDSCERAPNLPSGWFNWVVPFFKIPDTYVLNHSSLDGFFFLRFMRVLCLICLVGCCITWPILLPLHATGGGGNTQLDRLTFGNVTDPKKYYVHTVVAILYFGFVLYLVCRECIFYINVRQAYLFSPYYANRLSSRTVLFTCVPKRYLDEERLRRVFGPTVQRIWIPRDSSTLEDLVKERDQTAARLEKAEVRLIRMANAARTKLTQHGHPDLEASPGHHGSESASSDENKSKELRSSVSRVTSALSSPNQVTNGEPTFGFGQEGPPPDINGSVASQWLSHSARPYHRPIANYGRRVDTIKWTRLRLKELNVQIRKLRREQHNSKDKQLPSVFIEFENQVDAQAAYQSLSHHRPLHMSPRFIGVRPFEIIWTSLRMSWWERIIRRFSIQCSIAAMVIFWSIPSAFVGSVSNVKYLSTKVSFLHWINTLPSPVLGFLTSLVPAALLSCLMAIVPMLMRACARVAGVPSLSRSELFTQTAYFAFQVVQVFLITTLTSAASAAITSIIDDPPSAKNLLAQNLPKASNFYISYFLLQGLAISAWNIAHLPGVLRHYVISRFAKTPRLMYNRWNKLKVVHWGAVFPVFTNMAVIAISYSCIAPIILGFAGVGMYVVYTVYRYNLIFVYDSEIDTRGLVYPRALMHMLTGLYLSEICLLGLFAIKGAYGCVVIIFLFFIFSVLVHVSVDDAVGPLLYNLPKSLAVEEEDALLGKPDGGSNGAETDSLSADEWDFGQTIENGPTAPIITTATTNDDGHHNNDHVSSSPLGNENNHDYDPDSSTNDDVIYREPGGASRSLLPEGSPAFLKFSGKWLFDKAKTELIEKPPHPYLKPVARCYTATSSFLVKLHSPDPSAEKPHFLFKWLHPEVYADYRVLRGKVPDYLPSEMDYPAEPDVGDVYYPPAMWSVAPSLWIPRDEGGISTQECRHSGKVVSISDVGAHIDPQGRVAVELNDPEKEEDEEAQEKEKKKEAEVPQDSERTERRDSDIIGPDNDNTDSPTLAVTEEKAVTLTQQAIAKETTTIQAATGVQKETNEIRYRGSLRLDRIRY